MTYKDEHAYYREKTARMTVFNLAQKYCLGCRRKRSAGQFESEANYCRKCVLRGVKA